MKKMSIIFITLLGAVTLLTGCTSSQSHTSNQEATFSSGDKPNVAGYEEIGTHVEGSALIYDVVLTKTFSQAELENIIRAQDVKGEKIIFNFYKSKKEIEDRKTYTVAQITVEKGKMTYKAV